MPPAALAAVLALAAPAAAQDDRALVAALDARYQAAVKANDATVMDEILHDQMVLVVGKGAVIARAQLLKDARDKSTIYERRDEEPGSQTVRLYGKDTAVVTAKLGLNYTMTGVSLDGNLWFSDTYVRTARGWKYAFGQASIALPPT